MKKVQKMLLLIISIILLTGCGGEKKERVIIYTSMEENRIQALKEKINKEFTNYDIIIQYMSTGNSAAKIKNEGLNIEADIIIDLETSQIENLKENFADISDFDSSIYIDGVNKSDKYFTWAKETSGLIIDKKYFKEHKLEIPKTYDDLLKKEYRGIIAMPDPKTSGTGYAFYLNVVNIMGEDKAIEYFKKLKNNLREFTTSGSGPTNLLKQGEIAIAMGMVSQGVAAINDGYNFEIVELDSKTPYNTTSYGIIKGKETKESVKKVFEWISTEAIRYDKENFMPDIILKNQNNKVKNYPTNLKDANMNGIDSIKTKEHLIEVWSKVNG